MNTENFLNKIIERVQVTEFTPALLLIVVLAFIFILVFYHRSGLSERVENLSAGKKAVVFFFIALFIFCFYYIFYKAGKFDAVLDHSAVSGLVDMFKNLLKSGNLRL